MNFKNEQNEFIYKAILDNMHEGVILIDSSTKVLYVNDSYYEILGIKNLNIIGEYLSKIQPFAKIIQVLKTGEALLNVEFTFEETEVRIVANILPIFDDSDEVTGTISVFRDITEVRNLTKQLEQLKGYTKYLKEELEYIKDENFKKLVGNAPSILNIIEKMKKVSKTDSTVLITGESGTGKEVITTIIHSTSPRVDKPMIKVNCAAIPETLLESEFFGYEEGSFTGSKKGGKLGKFELANGGTIFLDEIGDMSLNLQAKLLRVLQEKKFERIGGESSISVDVRIIAATNADLMKKVKNKEFREDLYYRLNVFPIEVPPLRERKSDILTLAIQFLEELTLQYKKQLSFSAEVTTMFYEYDWPGNIRELKNVVEHAVIMSDKSGRIRLGNLPSYLLEVGDTIESETNYLKLYKQFKFIEKKAIEDAVLLSKYNRSEAMRILGMSRKTFYKKMKEYDIQ